MGDTQIPMAASTLSDLQAGVGSLIIMNGIKPQDAVIVRPSAGGPDQLWVRPDYLKYREAWRAAFGSVASGYQVDHLYSKARALAYGYGYVRLVLTDSKVNMSFGGGIEKQMLKVPTSRDPSIAPTKVPIRYADWWQIQKLDGVILGGRAKGCAPTSLLLQPSILGGSPGQTGKKGRFTKPSRGLKYSTVHFRPVGSSKWIAQRGVKDYSFAGDVVGWVMEGLVYQRPANSDAYNFSTQLFMSAFIVGSGSSSEKVFAEHQEQGQRSGTLAVASIARGHSPPHESASQGVVTARWRGCAPGHRWHSPPQRRARRSQGRTASGLA